MLDASKNINSDEDFKLCVEFIKVVFHAFGMAGGIRFALVTFGGTAKVVFDFKEYSSISDVDLALDKVWINYLSAERSDISQLCSLITASM